MPKQERVLKIDQKQSRNGARFETRIDIPERNRQQLCELLNQRLADSMDLYSQAKFAHWNVKGKDFYQVHLLFDTVAEHVEEGIDLIAERVTALGGIARGTIRQAAEASALDEYDLDANSSMEHVRALADRLAEVANSAREAIDQADELEDQATADLFTDIVRQLDQDLYFLEAHLQG